MSSKAVRDAFRTKLAAIAPGAVPFKDSVNTARQDDANTPYITADFAGGSEIRLSTGDPGNDWWKETGTVLVVARVPRGNGLGGTTDPEVALTTVGDALRGATLSGTVRVLETDPIDTSGSDDTHFRAVLPVRYVYYRRG
jgi:hypothetical protein